MMNKAYITDEKGFLILLTRLFPYLLAGGKAGRGTIKLLCTWGYESSAFLLTSYSLSF